MWGIFNQKVVFVAGVKGDIVLLDYSPPSVDSNGIKRDTSVACRVGGLFFTVQPDGL